MSAVYLIESLRTPFGSFGGALSDVPAVDMAASVIKQILENTGLKGGEIDEVILGQVIQGGAGQAPARQAMIKAGIPNSVHAMTINKVCGSGLKTMMLASQSIQVGDSNLVIAGGMENMSAAPYALPTGRYGAKMGNAQMLDLMMHDALVDPYSTQAMGVLTEGSVARTGVTREEQDELAARSYKLSLDAINNGVLDDEIVPYVKKTRKGDVVIDKDEDPFNGRIDKLPTLKPCFKKDGTITAGNASNINDGAAITLLASEEAVKKYNLTPKAKLIAYSTNSIEPEYFGEAPCGAIEKAVAKAGLKLEDIDLFEINEAFAAVTLMAVKKHNLDIDKVNVNGGACSFGHPVGASGGRLVATLVRELVRQNKKYGLVTLCIGGGEAVAAVFERV
ncbi:MAG: acetyl-CoA C-acyltransferase [Denitrovibrio sp.]|nr:MAG: acetyl-CoA C-acyltransferase [Denitrovibrio sp.]